jgi:hypothetical protein
VELPGLRGIIMDSKLPGLEAPDTALQPYREHGLNSRKSRRICPSGTNPAAETSLLNALFLPSIRGTSATSARPASSCGRHGAVTTKKYQNHTCVDDCRKYVFKPVCCSNLAILKIDLGRNETRSAVHGKATVAF